MRVEEQTNATTTHSGAPTAETGEERVSVVSGDRFCTECGYNLVGQSVLREQHYGMFIVRCPECATVAALQEYPLLGKWAGRWAVLFAVLFFIMLTGAWTGSSLAFFGLSIATAEEAVRDYTQFIQSEYQADTKLAKIPSITATATPAEIRNAAGKIAQQQKNFGTWWGEQDAAAILAGQGGWLGAAEKKAFWLWVPAGVAAFAIGNFWSIALLTVRRRYLPLCAIAIVTLAACFVSMTVWDWMNDDLARSWRAGRAQIAPSVAALTLGYLMIPLIAGLLLGRSLTRLLVRGLLPPRLRNALALLWTTDGLELPRTRSVSR